MAEMTDLQRASHLLMKVFDKYACEEGRKDTLSKTEVKKLVVNEMQHMLKEPQNQEELDSIMANLDITCDQEVSFYEYVLEIASVTCACHNRKSSQQCQE